MRIIASITTIPSRIDQIRVCLESLLKQTVPVEHIEINIPDKCIRTGEDYVIPEWMKTMEKLQIFRTADIGAITKVAPTFLRYMDDDETFIWSVDDDWKYPEYTLEKLTCEHDPANVRILAHSGVNYSDSLQIEYLHGGSKFVQIAEGYTSILYPPQVAKPDFSEYLAAIATNPDCLKSDDLILGNYFAKIGVKSYLTAFSTQKRLFSFLDRDLIQPYEADKHALHKQDQGHAIRYVQVMGWLKRKKLLFLTFPITGPPTIGLCMIVKDESHIVHEVLNSTVALIDTFCILDTGSTDNTVGIIEDFYQKAGIKGEVVRGDWKGFGASRSEALKLCDGKMDYILMIDADDLMSFPPNSKAFIQKVLSEHRPNAAILSIQRGGIFYERTQLFKASDGWRYVGVLHEYPTNDNPNNRMVRLPPEIFMIGRTLGNRSKQDGNKYLKDAEVILKELEKEPDNDRYVFYLAQSYRDGGNIPEAIKWYKKRVEMGKWKEEQCVSAMNIARILNDKEWAWKAHEFNTERNESLVHYASYCRANNMFTPEVLAMIMYATTIPKPKENVLFVETDIYEWRMWDELAVIAFHTGRKDISKQAGARLLSENRFPPDQRARIENNLKCALN
uniref:Glycosyltransferase 2-like domain-containing protein n=1 Tax=viral metagenome TaxID=1070528 RepID=A0A6C0CV50_9ZZZZ